ncbi:MAG: CoA-binding protein [Candidatus Micrarchaeia archaeon]
MGIPQILTNFKIVAVVGASRDPTKDSRTVFEYLLAHGFEAYPVNPNADQIGDQKCYKSLSELPKKPEIVDIFRPSAEVPPIVDEAIRVGAKVIWMQLGIINEEAAAKARKAGLEVVMDHCMRIENEKMKNRK